jgi:hypothetical protein
MVSLDLFVERGKIATMSRRRRSGKVDRNTARYGERAEVTGDGKSPPEQTEDAEPAGAVPERSDDPVNLACTAIDPDASALPTVHEPAPEESMSASSSAPAPESSFRRSLQDALPDDLDEPGDQRTTSIVARYFKLTFAMVLLNMVVAGANVAMLFRHSEATRTIVVTQAAPATAPAPVAPQVPATTPAPAAPDPAAAAAQLVPAAPSPGLAPAPAATPIAPAAERIRQPTLPRKIPLLGTPPAARTRPLQTGGDIPVRSPRMVAALPHAKRSALPAPTVEDEDRDESSRLAERW